MKQQETGRTMLKVREDENFFIFKTIARDWKSDSLYVNRCVLDELNRKERITVNDCGSIATFYRNPSSGMAEITFYWTQRLDGGKLTGRWNKVLIPWQAFSDFMERSAQPDGPKVWKALSDADQHYPRLIFSNSKRLKEVIANKVVKRKFFKYLRNAFKWPNSDEIHIYGDFEPYSFTFCEFRNGREYMNGGIILHNREDMNKAYYAIHT